MAYDPASKLTLAESPVYQEVRAAFKGCLSQGLTLYGFPDSDASKLAAATFHRVLENLGGTNVVLERRCEKEKGGAVEEIILEGHKPVALKIIKAKKGNRYTAAIIIGDKPEDFRDRAIAKPVRDALHALCDPKY